MELNNNAMVLADVEKELAELIGNDKTSWVRIYELMHTVEEERMYEAEHRSFTAWVNDFATKSNVHVSLLWSRLKAGKMYARYSERAQSEGRAAPALAELEASPDSLILVEKISQGNATVADALTEKVIRGELGRADLKNAWATVRASKGARVRVNAHDAPEKATEPVEQGAPQDAPKADEISAKDIVLALCSSSWLPAPVEKAYQTPKYKLITEFPIQTPTAHHARRIDALVLETITTKGRDELAVHGVEIKVSKSDLLADHKMQEYVEHVDYFWIAVPQALLADVQEIKLPEWGVIVIDAQAGAKVAVPARRGSAPLRANTIESALIRIL